MLLSRLLSLPSARRASKSPPISPFTSPPERRRPERERCAEASLSSQRHSSIRSVLHSYRNSAAAVEDSDLDYTILRPGWFHRTRAVHYEMAHKGEPFPLKNATRVRGADASKRARDPVFARREGRGLDDPAGHGAVQRCPRCTSRPCRGRDRHQVQDGRGSSSRPSASE